MEVIAAAIAAVGDAIAAWATAYAVIYVAGIGTKTFLIWSEKATAEELKTWFDFKILGRNDKKL